MNNYHEEEVLGKAYDSRLLKRLLTYLRPYWLYVVLGVFILLIATALDLVGPFLIKIAIDRNIVPKVSTGLFHIVMIYLGVQIFQFGFKNSFQFIKSSSLAIC